MQRHRLSLLVHRRTYLSVHLFLGGHFLSFLIIAGDLLQLGSTVLRVRLIFIFLKFELAAASLILQLLVFTLHLGRFFVHLNVVADTRQIWASVWLGAVMHDWVSGVRGQSLGRWMVILKRALFKMQMVKLFFLPWCQLSKLFSTILLLNSHYLTALVAKALVTTTRRSKLLLILLVCPRVRETTWAFVSGWATLHLMLFIFICIKNVINLVNFHLVSQ